MIPEFENLCPLIEECWAESPSSRPNFIDIIRQLKRLLGRKLDYIVIIITLVIQKFNNIFIIIKIIIIIITNIIIENIIFLF